MSAAIVQVNVALGRVAIAHRLAGAVRAGASSHSSPPTSAMVTAEPTAVEWSSESLLAERFRAHDERRWKNI